MRNHNTASEHDHMKNFGLSQFHDLGKVIASPKAEWKRPYWVTSVDRPTVEIDWSRIERFDARKHLVPNLRQYTSAAEFEHLEVLRKDNFKKWILVNRPGYTLRDYALSMAVRMGSVDSSFIGHWQNASGSGHGWQMFSPEELGVPRWEGRPEENSRMIRAFARFSGASQVGFLELDEHTRKLIYAFDEIDGKKLEFEDVDKAYETKDKRVLPNKAAWVIVFSVQMSKDTMKRTKGAAPTPISIAATYQAYARSRFIIDQLQTFLHMIGYQGLMGPSWNALGIAPALGVMAGLGELSRLNRLVSPEYGPMQRVFKLVTDLPLAPTRPIDAGIMRFCRTCKICANSCPTKALSLETEPSWEIKGHWNNPGVRTYYDDSPKCASYWWKSTVGCSTCISSCPFGKQDGSFLHRVVAATIARTPALNGLFTRTSGILDTNETREPDDWWKLDLPPNGVE